MQDTYVYDIETYGNVFTFAMVRLDGEKSVVIEVSPFKNELPKLFVILDWLADKKYRLIGFNNQGFDYPVVHRIMESRRKLLKLEGEQVARIIFQYAQEQIETSRDGFAKVVSDDETLIEQIDLFKIHHFDNKARATSLKMLEFNMRADNIEDLPYPVGADLDQEQIKTLIKYNLHDVEMTRQFCLKSMTMIEFRKALTEKYNRNFMNHNDTKIGKDYFIMKLEENIPGSCYRIEPNGRRKLNQTKRPFIDIRDCLFGYYDFQRPEFIAVLDWFKNQRIKETKGVFSDIEEHRLGDVAKYAQLEEKKIRFKGEPTKYEWSQFLKEHPKGWLSVQELKATEYAFDENGNHIMEYPLDSEGSPDFTKKPKKKRVPKKSYWGYYRVAETLNVVIDGFRFDFGTGGIHGSISGKIATETRSYAIVDADVSSMYPNIGISNRVYPEHLSDKFCDIYQDVYEQRKSYPKGSTENLMLKLALNGVYGDSNNEFSPFYDPMYTMKITINGQLSLCLLAEKLMRIEGLKLIQVNTDGVTVALPRDKREEYDAICAAWQKQVKLNLEFADYSKMLIRDVNNYIAVYTNGKVKRKGAYQYEDLGWHQNQGGLIIPMAAEAAMLHGRDTTEFIAEKAKDPDSKWLFMLRTKVPRSSRLVMVMEDSAEIQQQNICRYYISTSGGNLVKIMPPLEGDTEERRLGIDIGWKVRTCNKMVDQLEDVDLSYYVQEAEKLVIRKE